MAEIFGNLMPENLVAGPVDCLGMTFPTDMERRRYFMEKLREKLQEPEFRKINGFPLGSDEDILALSDPPYYTACPNPWLADFLKRYGMPHDPRKPYSREPFAADVSEGKNDPIYNAHSYHTKVPHKAIMRYILHYTDPGDVVFDGFCGTGMTGVAAQMCGDRKVIESLGYRVDEDGTIFQEEVDEKEKPVWKPFSKLGTRRAILNDLSPAATFIAYNYNTPVDVNSFEREANRILKEVESECGWMYETMHTDGKTKGKINYTVWSDVFVCPECSKEVVFWEAAIDKKAGSVREEFPCPHCGVSLTKRRMDRAWTTKYDNLIKATVRQAKQVPVLINYTVNRKRYEKSPELSDLDLIEKIETSEIPYWVPSDRMPEGKESRRNDDVGITHVHDFYTRRNLWVLGAIWARFLPSSNRGASTGMLAHSAANPYASKMRRFRADRKGGGPLSGTLYVSSLMTPPNVVLSVERNVNFVRKALSELQGIEGIAVVTTQSSDESISPAESVDYIFTDPPFGGNLMYSELNFLWEAWLKVFTSNKLEAIENSVQGKGSNEYRHLMTLCFKEAYRILKPGRWMTVEFSNTKASVWNSIQTALTEAGFIVANVSMLDKKQGSFKAVTTPTAVKQDLIISAYKPNGGFEERFQQEAQTEEGIWDFVRTHLKYLPVVKRQGKLLQIVPERDPRILFDQMIAFYVRKGYPVPISSQEFQFGLAQRFIERDGMYFLSEQAAEYDRKKMVSGETVQASLFVSDESSAIQWLRSRLRSQPQIYSEIQPDFMPLISHINTNERELLSLDLLLEQNFLCYDGNGEVPSQIHRYLSSNFKELRNLPKDDESLRAKGKDRWYVPDPNKAGDLEKLRERSLLKEFDDYRTSTQKRLKIFRLEAVRAGFKKAWQERDYATIITIAKKIPDTILQEDPKLLLWYDQALTRSGEEN